MMGVIRVHVHPPPPSTHIQRFMTQPCNKMSSKPRISCSNSNDIELAMELETEVEKMKLQTVRTHEAMKRSRKMLYEEMCLYLGLGKDEMRRKWETMEQDDKWMLAQEFVSDWGSNFHPLSAKSVRELVDQHLFHDDDDDDNNNNNNNNSSALFTGLKKLMGFPE